MISLFMLIVMSQGHYIPYQAHGFNDLGYFMQQIKKGTTYFKMDVAPATRDSCINYSNWVPNSNCEVFSSGFEICCLTFRGDTASIPIFKQDFNISSELFEVIKNNPTYFGKNTPTKVLAFNFQYSDKFALLTKTFLAGLVDLMEQFNVQIIIGSDAFWQSYIDKCQTTCDPIEKKIANAKFYFQTGSIAKPSDPKQGNFNVFYEQINQLCEQGWPEWNDKFGMIFWEPSHEYQVQLCRQKFESPTCKISDNLRKVENLRIASNLEPETMQIYWKKLVQDKDSFDLTDNKHIQNGQYQAPKIEYVASCNQYVTTFQFNGKSTIQIKDITYQTVFTLNTNIIIDSLNLDGTTFLVQGSTAYEIYAFQGCSKFAKISSGEVKQNQVLSIVQREQNTELVVVTFYADLQKALIEFSDATTRQVNGITNIQNINSLQNVVIDTVYTDKYFIALSYTQETLLNKEDVFKKIYLSLIQITPDYVLLKYLPALKNIDYGTISEIKLSKINNQVFVASIQSDGLCQSAILLNNNEWNKCSFVNQEEYASLINVDHMINYFWGKWDDVWDRVSTGTPINGCDFKVMHAKLGNGDKPSIAIKNGEAVVVTEFVHYEEQGAFTQLFCGSSNDYPGVSKGILTFSFDIVKAEDL